MPLLDRMVLMFADLQQVVATRRRNYSAFLRTLARTRNIWPLRESLRDDTCPWGFPVVLQDRAERDYVIRSKGVPVFTFGEVLHPLLFEQQGNEKLMIDSARFLSESLLCLAIHQQLNEQQILGYASVINEYVASL
jgi:perosamine synthetase